VMFIFREEVYKKDDPSLEGLAELIIAKQRNGPIGTVKLAFLKSSTRFENYMAEPGMEEEG
ncbi:MAG TPA: DnaB-like helicase C-terminal domain-containing protein, partial [Terriglobales bacterium]|nr:DnaB-like helicase C-terminal domain-containing protein [Terriglobales bacterium]